MHWFIDLVFYLPLMALLSVVTYNIFDVIESMTRTSPLEVLVIRLAVLVYAYVVVASAIKVF